MSMPTWVSTHEPPDRIEQAHELHIASRATKGPINQSVQMVHSGPHWGSGMNLSPQATITGPSQPKNTYKHVPSQPGSCPPWPIPPAPELALAVLALAVLVPEALTCTYMPVLTLDWPPPPPYPPDPDCQSSMPN